MHPRPTLTNLTQNQNPILIQSPFRLESARASSPRAATSSHLAPAAFSKLGILILFFVAAQTGCFLVPSANANGLDRVRSSGVLRYGSDMEGGGPYAYPDPRSPRDVTGFEVELMAMLGRDLGVTPEFCQGQWDKLLQVLSSGRLDAVINGYEWTENRAREYAATRPYYVYQLQLMVPRDSALHAWSDLKKPRPDGRSWTVGVLVGSAGDTYASEQGGPNVKVVRFDGATDAMTAVQNGQYDATLQDLPAARFYRERFPGLELAGPPESHGYYVIYTRSDDRSLRDALDQGLARLIASGDLRRLYERYGIWTEAQRELTEFAGPIEVVSGRQSERGWDLLSRYGSRLMDAALVTIALSFSSMPLAMALGLLIAVARLYGPAPVRTVLAGYVELIRGTPLMLQLFVLFYLLKLPPWVAGIGGLAINYSAYEAEIYRAGLQAIPSGQMEAALALGMSPAPGLAARDHPPGGADRHPAGDQRLHRPVQGHFGLLGGHPGRADQAVFDPCQQHRRRDRVRGGRGGALHDDERSSVVVLAVVGAAPCLWRCERGVMT